ncbi:MAG: hypothetical protein ABIZ34_09320, partial [Candidatus Limnocylindrales bacterium]
MARTDTGRVGLRAVVVAACLVGAGIISAAPVAAAPRVYALFGDMNGDADLSGTDLTGHVLVERLGGGQMRLTLALTGAGGQDWFSFKVIGSSGGCGRAVTSSNRTFRGTLQAGP